MYKMEINKKRGFTEINNATLAFVRKNFFALSGYLLAFGSLFFLLTGYFDTLNLMSESGLINENNLDRNDILEFLASGLSLTMIAAVVFGYIFLYKEREATESIGWNDMLKTVGRKMPSILLTVFLIYFTYRFSNWLLNEPLIHPQMPTMIFFWFLLQTAVSSFLFVVLSFSVIILFEGKSPLKALVYSIHLSFSNFWQVFWSYLAVLFIITVLVFPFFAFYRYVQFQELVQTIMASSLEAGWKIYGVNILLHLVFYYCFSLMAVTAAFVYYSALENKEKIKMLRKIELVGAHLQEGHENE